MMKCSAEAYAKCPTRHLCGRREEAIFLEGSECDKFNEQIRNHPMTNADRIRAMSDEELAVVIMCPHESEQTLCTRPEDCLSCCIEWLKQPAKEDG